MAPDVIQDIGRLSPCEPANLYSFSFDKAGLSLAGPIGKEAYGYFMETVPDSHQQGAA